MRLAVIVLVALVTGNAYAQTPSRPVQISEKVTEKELPAPVVAAMRSHPRAIFGSGMKVMRKGVVHYELTLKGTRKTHMVVKPDGTVISFK